MPDIAIRQATFDDRLGELRFTLEQVCRLLEASLLAVGDLSDSDTLLVIDEVRRDNDRVQTGCADAKREALALAWHVPSASCISPLLTVYRDARVLAKMGWLVVELAEAGAPMAEPCRDVLRAVQSKMLAATTDLYVVMTEGDRRRANDVGSMSTLDGSQLHTGRRTSAGRKTARRLVRTGERWTSHAMSISRRAAAAAA
ncbi:hypothetical protein H7J86_14390 [Mycobacterium hackensackense]|jgi:hypothetical protein|uniref:hypothetical protein n=1 Tax=Mycobacterium hackensackense TaxID=228909 RepID=UPI002265E632|nr:hypothetical protein [Mycobacterium hackensackense]MCV7253358.1 hypothetical protein [Mycobacterium hackensackense]